MIAHPGNYPDIGRFQFYHHTEKGKVVTYSTPSLPRLELVPAIIVPAERSEVEQKGR